MSTVSQAIYQQIQSGQLTEAEAACRAILAQQANSVDALHLLGIALHYQGKNEAALAALTQALSLLPEHTELYNSTAIVLTAMGRTEEALKHYQTAVTINPQYYQAWYNAGRLLKTLGQLETAQRYYETAIALNPDYVDAYNNLGNVLKELEDHGGAESAYLKARAISPGYAPVHDNLGLLYMNTGADEKAKHCFETAIQLQPDETEAYRHLALLLLHSGLGTLEDAQRYYDTLFQLSPEHPKAKADYSLLKLLTGDYKDGFALYEYRRHQPQYGELNIPLPEWRGEPLTQEDTLFIYGEQGLGDTFQMMRYLPQITRQGARVIFRTSTAMQPIIAHCPGVTRAVTSEELPSIYPQCTHYCFSMSLPKLLDSRLESLPPILAPETWVQPTWLAPWQARLSVDHTLKIGLVWGSRADHRTARYRSCPIEALHPLTKIPGVTFYSFQKGDLSGEIEQLQGGASNVIDLTPDLIAMTDTVGAASQMDLILTVDTMMAHLGGSLNKPTWVMLPARPDWRWLLERPDSPWYNHVRLFRQPAPGDWHSVVASVAEALHVFRSSQWKEASHV